MNLLALKDLLISVLYSSLFISFASKGWAQKLMGIDFEMLTIFIFSLISILNMKHISNYMCNICRRNYRSIDFWIISQTLLYLGLNTAIFFEGLSFLGLFILISAILSDQQGSNLKNISNFFKGLIISSLVFSLGIIIGFGESLFFDSTWLNNQVPLDYPNPVLNWFNGIFNTNFTAQISGFNNGINYAAYMLIGGIFFINSLNKKSLRTYLLSAVLIFCLMLTNAKVGIFFVVLLTTILLQKNFLNISALVIACFYILLCHFTFNSNADEVINNTYFYKKVIGFEDISIYLSLFSWLKIESISYLLSEGMLGTSIEGFISRVGHEPHSIFFSMLFLSGPITLILFIFFLIRIIRMHYDTYSPKDCLANIVFIIFLAESIVWDGYDSPIFWVMILLPRYKQFLANVSKY